VDTNETMQMGADSGFQDGMSIKELLHILKVRLPWIIIIFLLVMGAAIAYLFYVTPLYESSVTILVEPVQKSSDMESLLMGQSTTKIATEVELVLSRRNISDALESLDLDSYISEDQQSYRDPKVLGDVKARTTVTTVKDTNIVKITVTDQNPIFARDFANALAESHGKLLGTIARNSKTVQKDFIASQIPINEEKLQAAADALGIFRQESRIIQLSDKSTLLSEKIAYFQLRKEPLALQLNESVFGFSQYAAVLGEAGITYPTYEELATDVDITSLLESLKDNKRELVLYEAIQDGDTTENPRLFVLQNAISKTSKALLDRITLLMAPQGLSDDAYITLCASEMAKAAHQWILTESEIEILDSIESSYTLELSELPALERKLVDLERDVSVYEALRLRLMELLEEVKIAEAAVTGSVTMVDAAKASLIPVSPNKMLILAVALLLGVAFGVLVALGIEMIDITIKDEGVIKKLTGPALPILGWVPLMNFDQSLEIPSLVVKNDPLSFEAERYKLIANNISYGTLRKVKRVFSITSPGMAEGKTSAVCNIALSLTQNGLKVLIVDGDLRLPQLERFFNLRKSHHGLVDVVSNGLSAQEVIVQPLAEFPSLHLMPPGILPPLPSAVFTSPEYADMLEHLLDIYDFILIDTPPLVFASELMAIARHVDGLVINIRAGVTTKGALRELLDNLELLGVNILGIIFNSVIETKAGGHYTNGRYYTYQGASYTKRYYEGYAKRSQGDSDGKRETKKSQHSRVSRRSYRSNFIKDLKRREKGRGLGTNRPIHPFIDRPDPFFDLSVEASQSAASQAQANAPDIENARDFLEAVELDPRAGGRT